jgi:hypothetical protein
LLQEFCRAFSNEGTFSFGPGICISPNVYAEQMSTAWIKIIAHNLAKKIKRDNPQYADNFDYKCLKEITASPAGVIRALATGYSIGNLKTPCLAGYRNSEYDNQYLMKMFS